MIAFIKRMGLSVRLLMRTLLAGALFVAVTSALAQETATRLDRDNAALSSSNASIKVKVAITTRRAKTSEIVLRAEPGQFPPEIRVVKDLFIEVNGKAVYVPRSAFADLIWVTSAELAVKERRGTLIIRGGDASESYFARIVFDSARVRSRAVFDPAAPAKPLEESRYFEVVIE